MPNDVPAYWRRARPGDINFTDPNVETFKCTTQAMFAMTKLEIAALERAFAG